MSIADWGVPVADVEKCPCCLGEEVEPVRFTPWGGVIGPRLLSLVKCCACGIQYNGKSGRRVDRAIRVYTSIMLGVLVLLAACTIYSFAAASGPTKKGVATLDVPPQGAPTIASVAC